MFKSSSSTIITIELSKKKHTKQQYITYSLIKGFERRVFLWLCIDTEKTKKCVEFLTGVCKKYEDKEKSKLIKIYKSILNH